MAPKALAVFFILITKMNVIEFSCAFTLQDSTVAILNQVLPLIGTAPQKLDFILWNAPRTYVQSFSVNEPQVRLDLCTSHKTYSIWSDIFGRKRADELPLVNIFLPANLSETLHLLSQVNDTDQTELFVIAPLLATF